MYEINERIKLLRKTLKMSQTEFGEKLHVSRGVIKNIDDNLVEPKPLFIDNICVTFNVRREWLTDGEGEMFREIPHREKVAAFIGEALADEPESFRRRFIEATADFTKEDWIAIERLAKIATKLYHPPED